MECDVMLAVRDNLNPKKTRKKTEKSRPLRQTMSRQTCMIEREREEVDEVELHVLGCRVTY